VPLYPPGTPTSIFVALCRPLARVFSRWLSDVVK
jgi:hypothetical protein